MCVLVHILCTRTQMAADPRAAPRLRLARGELKPSEGFYDVPVKFTMKSVKFYDETGEIHPSSGLKDSQTKNVRWTSTTSFEVPKVRKFLSSASQLPWTSSTF